MGDMIADRDSFNMPRGKDFPAIAYISWNRVYNDLERLPEQHGKPFIKGFGHGHDHKDPQHGQNGIYTMDDNLGKEGRAYYEGKTLTCSTPRGPHVTPIDQRIDSDKDPQSPEYPQEPGPQYH